VSKDCKDSFYKLVFISIVEHILVI